MTSPRIGALFAGYGGLDLATTDVFGGSLAWYSEVDKGALKILGHRFPDVPNVGDVTAVKWTPDCPNCGELTALYWNDEMPDGRGYYCPRDGWFDLAIRFDDPEAHRIPEPVDILTGGSPCQDLSHAGRRAGMTGRTVIPAGMQFCGCQWADHQPDCEAASPKGLVPASWADDPEMQAKAIRQLNKWDRKNPDFNRPERVIDHGTRSNLWVAMREAIAQLRPSIVVWENVRGAYSASADSAVEPCAGCVGDGSGVHLRALGRVLGDLSDLGYDARWHGIRAADVGAPHGRFRVFVVATDTRRVQRREGWAAGPGEAEGGRAFGDAGGRDLDALRVLPTPSARDWKDHTIRREPHRPNDTDTLARALTDVPAALLPTPRAGDGTKGGPNQAGSSGDLMLPSAVQESRWGAYAAAIARWEHTLGRPAPAPTQTSTKGNPQLSPAFVEWMMGLPAGWVTDVPGITRNEALKALGNGVVPQQAAAAIRAMRAWSVAA